MRDKNPRDNRRRFADEQKTEYAPFKASLPLTMLSTESDSVNLADLQLPSAYAARFVNVRLLGEGGAGAVYAAHDTELDRTVAIKVLRHIPAGISPKEFAQREARALAALHHPGIVTLYDWISGDNCAWLILEHVPGPSLAHDVQSRGRLPADEAVQICIQVCHALQYAHEHGVLHLDIKPGNVLRADGGVKVTDFGIAYHPKPGEAGPGWGTPGFAPPEQLAGRPVAQSDVYAAAALLWTTMTGEINEGAASMQKRQNWRLIPSSLRPILRAALSVRIEARPSTPRDLAAAVQSAIAGDTPHSYTQRAWDMALTGLLVGFIMFLLAGRSPIAIVTPNQSAWLGVALTALGFRLPASATLLALLCCNVATLGRVPTLGVMFTIVWPVLVPLVKLYTRSALVVLLTPFLYAIGWGSIIPILAGCLLLRSTAIGTVATASIAASGIIEMLRSPLVQAYFSAAYNATPSPTLLSQVATFIGRISPRDIILSLWPTFWQAALSLEALWLTLTSVLAVTVIMWAKSRLQWSALSILAPGLVLLYEAVWVYHGGVFSGLRLFLTCLAAWLIVQLAPSRFEQNRYKIETWLRNQLPVRKPE